MSNIVKEITQSQIEAVEAQFSLSMLRKAETGWLDYKLNSTSDLIEQCVSIQNSTYVLAVEVSSAIRFNLTPNDSATYQGQTWYNWSIPITDLDKAWDKTTGDPSIVAAVLDSGVDWWHEDFAQATGTSGTFWLNDLEDDWLDPNDPASGNKTDDDGNGLIDDWRGWNFAEDTNDISDEVPQNAHGTGVAGILGARTHNVHGISGVAGGFGSTDGIKLMVKMVVSGTLAAVDSINSSAFDDAILYAAENGARIIVSAANLYSNHGAINDAIERAYNLYHCVLFVSSGNDSVPNPVRFPASHPLVHAVANSNSSDLIFNSCIGSDLDFGAPGHNLAFVIPNNKYKLNTGTSISAPFAAGVAGLMLSINPCLGNEEVGNILKRRADKVNPFPASPNGFRYDYDPKKPGHSLGMGYGRINALNAVNTAEAMKENTLDLYIKDHYEDFGYPGSYPASTFYSDWSDIWVRNQPDGHINREMEEIEYSFGHDVYVYVHVRNKSCVASTGNERLKVYWTKFSSSSSWPQNWDGSQPNIGDQIADVPIPALQPGDDTILQFNWSIQIDTAHWGRCIMGRIEGTNDPITAYSDLGQSIRYNNNIAIRNLTVVNNFPGKVGPMVGGIQYPDGIYGYVGLPDDGIAGPVDINLDVPFDYTGATIIEDAEVRVFMSDELWTVFQASDPGDWEGIEISGDKEIMITSPHAKIRNLQFAPGQRCSLYVGFNFLTDEVDSTLTYRYHVTQYRNEILDGGMHFTINRQEREDFEADAGPDQFIYQGQAAQISASDINEPATYNWYDSSDSLIYSGKSPALSPTMTEKYKLEVIAHTDLYKDYDDVEIKVNPYAITSLSPNPATSNLTIHYDADEANSAYVILQPVSGGGGNNYILSTSQNQLTINVGSYPPAIYAVLLVCDGVIVDSEMLTIQ